MRVSSAFFAFAALAAAAPAVAQQPGVPAPEAATQQATQPTGAQPTSVDVADLRVNQLVIFEGDTCPASTSDTINVCAVLPGADRYRIPERLRTNPNDPERQAWTNRAIELSYVGASGIGSCSTAGPGGMIGCSQQLINQAVAERRGRPEVNWARLIEEARQERLGQIDERAAEEEATAEGRTPRRVQELTIQPGQSCPPSTELVIIMCNVRQPGGATQPQQ
jgi:hypothetical protein